MNMGTMLDYTHAVSGAVCLASICIAELLPITVVRCTVVRCPPPRRYHLGMDYGISKVSVGTASTTTNIVVPEFSSIVELAILPHRVRITARKKTTHAEFVFFLETN